jgi:hypothetical protein
MFFFVAWTTKIACKVSKKFKMAEIFKMAAKAKFTITQTNGLIYIMNNMEKLFFKKNQNGRRINWRDSLPFYTLYPFQSILYRFSKTKVFWIDEYMILKDPFVRHHVNPRWQRNLRWRNEYQKQAFFSVLSSFVIILHNFVVFLFHFIKFYKYLWILKFLEFNFAKFQYLTFIITIITTTRWIQLYILEASYELLNFYKGLPSSKKTTLHTLRKFAEPKLV